MKCIIPTALVCLLIAAPACAMDGSALQLNSGAIAGSTAQLNNNGYAGTYITLAEAGNVTVTVNATGTSFGGVDPRMNIVIADTKAGFDVASGGSNSYSHVFPSLPAGTYFIRTELNNDGGTGRALTINSLDVSGAMIDTSTSDTVLRANALAAADTYIDNFRKGPGKVGLVGVAPGTEVSVTLKRHEFNFGANFRGTTVTSNPGTNQQDVNFYLQNPAHVEFFTNHFNMAVPSNAGKWSSNEGTRDMSVTNGMAATDAIMDFADANGIRNRMHNLIWATQQPNWVNTMLSNPAGADTYDITPPTTNPHGTNLTNLNALYSDLVAPAGTPNEGEPSELHERIQYYVGDGDGDINDGDRARRYVELDVYNESWHTGVNTPGSSSNYWDRYGASGISDIYQDVALAVAAAGSDAKIYVNEYNILQNGNDDYGNWYRDHIEAIQNADGNPDDGPVEGVGMQYYAQPGHSTAYMQQVLQNMSVTGLPLTLSEFGVQGANDGVTLEEEEDAALILNESLRMLFGSPQATSFLIWGWGDGSHTGDLQRNSALVRSSNWTTLTLPGETWEDLLGIADHDGNATNGWTTDVTTVVGADGTIDFTGFYGDYELTIDGQMYDLGLNKGDPLYSLVIAAGDYNASGTVDAGDYVVWRDTLGSTGDMRADGDGNEMIDQGDYDVWKSLFGTTYGSGAGSLATVPEPASVVLLAIGAVACFSRRRRSTRPPVAAL
ncbi:MAG: endo-1,4-beta-xylanase [Pirellulales bacterium]